MGVLTEVSNEEELERAIAWGQRSLASTTAICAICRLISPYPRACTETGAQRDGNQRIRINTYAQVRELSHFANGFLIVRR